ncbi:hypothetical protein KPH14_007190 [Odynerus spinipes]|uniref:Uncharacterized protein n=1 Tax=Odynerus spinipes TaxID=1348599 RepID=A0AAD9VIB8_9HYME|nr:hypothetical protein KPH14_007190 [Odynerus spinipes]
MGDEASIFWAVILMIGVVIMMTTLLVCYVCLFRDLCCRNDERTKRRRGGRQSPLRDADELNRQKSDAIPMNDITQGDSMPTESEKV